MVIGMHKCTRSRRITAAAAAAILCWGTASAQQPADGSGAEIPPIPGLSGEGPPPVVEPMVPVVPVQSWPYGSGVTEDLGLRQRAWQEPESKKGDGQDTPGHKRVVYDPRRTVKVGVRTGMLTQVVLEPSEVIREVRIGDPNILDVAVPTSNQVLIKPLAAGVDTNLFVRTESGRAYMLYVFSENHRADKITDMRVDIVATGMRGPGGAVVQGQGRSGVVAPQGVAGQSSLGGPGIGPDRYNGATPAERGGAGQVQGQNDGRTMLEGRMEHTLHSLPRDTFGNLRTQAFDPGEIVSDLEAWAVDQESIDAIGPVRLYRTRHWTYVDFGEKAATLERWPSAWRVTDGTESPVNTRKAGRHGQIMIVEAVGDLALKSGKMLICIKQRKPGEGPPVEQPPQRPVRSAGASTPRRAEPGAMRAVALQQGGAPQAAPGQVPGRTAERARREEVAALQRSSGGETGTTTRVDVVVRGGGKEQVAGALRSVLGETRGRQVGGATVVEGVEYSLAQRTCLAVQGVGGASCQIVAR